MQNVVDFAIKTIYIKNKIIIVYILKIKVFNTVVITFAREKIYSV